MHESFLNFLPWVLASIFSSIIMRGMAMDSPANVVNAVVLVFTLISGLAIFLRLFMRVVLLRKAGFEDAWIMLAMVSTIAIMRPFECLTP